MKVLLLSTYELGRQPFGLASPAAWLRRSGHEAVCLDLSRQALEEKRVREAELVAFYVPMHTATRLALPLIEPVRRMNPRAHICFYGLYAPMNEAFLRELGVESILGGEFEGGLEHLAKRLAANGRKPGPGGRQAEETISLGRQKFLTPEREGLPPLAEYAHVRLPSGAHRVTGYTEASRGCKHLCRHCPIVPVYKGVFRVVDREAVMEDIRRQVTAGAEHITFGDPDFFNGTGHAMAIVEAVHREFPKLSYDVTIKIEHLRKQERLLPKLRDTGCLFVTSAVEAVDDEILEKLDKGHTRADFLHVVQAFREAGLVLQPTFVPFTPWTTLEGYVDLLRMLGELELVENVAPIQLAIRLLIPAGSRLLELEDVKELAGAFDAAGLVYPWRHADERVDALCEMVQGIVAAGEKAKRARRLIFEEIWKVAHEAAGIRVAEAAEPIQVARAAVPHLNEPWYC